MTCSLCRMSAYKYLLLQLILRLLCLSRNFVDSNSINKFSLLHVTSMASSSSSSVGSSSGGDDYISRIRHGDTISSKDETSYAKARRIRLEFGHDAGVPFYKKILEQNSNDLTAATRYARTFIIHIASYQYKCKRD